MIEPLGIQDFGAFVATGLLPNATPGHDLLYTASSAVRGGARAGGSAALGIGAGGPVHVALGTIGVSALPAAAAAAPASGAARWLPRLATALPRMVGAAFVVLGVRLALVTR